MQACQTKQAAQHPRESAFWSSVEGRGLHVEGEGNMSRV